MTATDARARRLGRLLVVLQFAALGVLVLLALPALQSRQVLAGAWVMAGAGVLLGLWALSCNRPGNFNIQPLPREGGQLVQSGLYRWIRHPMYTAVMALGLALAWTAHTLWAAAAYAVLVAVLTNKARFEECWMRNRHPAYAAYAARTRRFVPWFI